MYYDIKNSVIPNFTGYELLNRITSIIFNDERILKI